MPTLNSTEMAELAALRPTNISAFTTQDAINYYTYLQNKGFDYATLALSVVQNNAARGKIANSYSESYADSFEIDMSVGSANWKQVQYEIKGVRLN